MKTSEHIILSEGEKRRRKVFGLLGRALLFSITSVAAMAVLAIIYFIARDALPFFRDKGVTAFFFSKAWYPAHLPPQFGAAAIFAGSLLVTVAAVVVAVPPGVFAALCMSDILPFNVRQVLKPVIEMLAAIPSVAYGFFALVVLAPLLQDHGGRGADERRYAHTLHLRPGRLRKEQRQPDPARVPPWAHRPVRLSHKWAET